MIVDVHIHFLSPHAIEAARTAPGRYGVRVRDDGPRPTLVIGDEPPTRPLLEPLYTLARHLDFLHAQDIDAAVFGPLMDVGGYSLPPATGCKPGPLAVTVTPGGVAGVRSRAGARGSSARAGCWRTPRSSVATRSRPSPA